MSDLITGTHLQSTDLDGQNIVPELQHLGEWTGKLIFDPLSTELHKCNHKDRERKLKPVLKELGYKIELIKYQILRVVSRGYIDASAPTHLIPIRIEESASGTVYDPSTSPVGLAVGQRVFFNRPIIVEPGVDILLITAR